MLYAIKAVRRFIESAPWDGFVIDRFGPVGTAETDEEIMAAARSVARSIYHPTSTARMSPLNATWGVTDPQLRVKHVNGLRVVDASVFVSKNHVLLRLYGLNYLRSLPYRQRIPRQQCISLLNVPPISSRPHGRNSMTSHLRCGQPI